MVVYTIHTNYSYMRIHTHDFILTKHSCASGVLIFITGKLCTCSSLIQLFKGSSLLQYQCTVL